MHKLNVIQAIKLERNNKSVWHLCRSAHKSIEQESPTQTKRLHQMKMRRMNGAIFQKEKSMKPIFCLSKNTSAVSRLMGHTIQIKLENQSKMHPSTFLTTNRKYRENCLECNIRRKKPLSETKFREYLNTKFNLSLARLKVDACRRCDMFKALRPSQSQGSFATIGFRAEKKWALQLMQITINDSGETIKHAFSSEK